MNKISLDSKFLKNDPEMIPTRSGFGEGLVLAGEIDKNVVALCADLTDSTKMSGFAQKFPERFLEVGIAEQNMMGIAAGLALGGKIPYLASYAVFNPGRNWDQLRVSVCYSNLHVIIAGAHAGLSVGPDGATHQALEDIAITRVLPNLTVIVPCDAIETRKATLAALKSSGPIYIRFAREATPVITTEDIPFEIGRAQIFREGSDVTIIVAGPLVAEALKAAEKLSQFDIKAEVINNHTLKPLDKKALITSLSKTGAAVTVEEHQIIGGLFGAIAELAAEDCPVPIEPVGIKDSFGESGKPEELAEKYGLTEREIVEAVRRALARKSRLN